MSVQRVALIFDDTDRPETTGVYCRRALQKLVEVKHFRPVDVKAIPRGKFDLYLNIDDGLSYLLPADLHPAAWWAIDTHMDVAWCLSKSHDFDFVFAAQRDGAAQLCDEGISTTWLPLACDPELHRKHDMAKAHDVCFVGNIGPGERADLVRLLESRFPNTFVGKRYFDDMARTYSASRIVFNRSVRNDINMRVFEAAACGSLLLTNDLRDNGQEELFRDGVHLATYRDAHELLDKARFYLAREAVRERIATAGREEALARHTYRHRMQTLLEEVARKLAATPEVCWTGGAVRAGALSTDLAPVQPLSVHQTEPDVTINPPDAIDLSYFEFARPEVLALIPLSARRVLDIGCGAGLLGEALKARQPVEVFGIEMVEPAACQARTRLDHVMIGNLEEMTLDFGPKEFDAIICADVLEHLRNPEHLLKQARGWLRPEGVLIASVPNVRHHTVVRSLLDGNWTYEPAGLLDQTHLRFFTRRDMDQLFQRAGFSVTRTQIVPGPGDEAWWQGQSHQEVHTGRLRIGGLPRGESEEFYVYQYLLVASPSPNGGPALAAPTLKPQAESTVVAGKQDRRKKASARPSRSRHRSSSSAHPIRVPRKLRIFLLGDFGSSWRHEAMTANALLEQGHTVHRFHEYLMPSVDHVVGELNSGGYDCLLFYKGRIGGRSPEEVFAPTGERIAEVLNRAKVPGYTWYVDRAYQFALQPSREVWMRRVAPLCRVAFVADGVLARTDWAHWHVLREPVDHRTVQRLYVPDAARRPLAFIGQLYGSREEELAAVVREFPLEFITGAYGAALSPAILNYQIILGPRYPTVYGFWGNRVYVVLGHGGFFLGPEVEGMRDEGILPGVHYAPLGANPAEDIRTWLGRPTEREHIARAGQELILSRFTYAHAVRELCRIIEETR
jgi:2-polyprenyl-3-methyl-5-hydroxy-6-metoxy-1,4-benzoquinol methylase